MGRSGKGRDRAGERRRSPWAQDSAEEIASKNRPEVQPRLQVEQIAQINVRGDPATIQRFRRLCKEDRRTYADMLRILLDAFEADG